jgi:hypothetical protein
MKVYVLPADSHGCGHYRLIWPANVLEQQGHDVVIIPPRKGQGFLATTTKLPDGEQRLSSIQVPEDVDVLVIQRPAHYLQPDMIRIMRQNGIAVVVDMDDDMSAIHPDNAAFNMYRHRTNTPFSWRIASLCCREATLVTTSTRSLLKVYAAHGRGVAIDNYVPEAYLQWSPDPGIRERTLGWAGTTQSHPNDPQVTAPAIQRLIEEGHPFKVVGGESRVKSAFRLKQDPVFTGTVGLADWARTMSETYDVGMLPLAATSFNTSKSRLKAIEHMAVGIPWVASPREEYRRVHKESGCGFLASSPKEWYQMLKALLTDDTLAKEQAEAGKGYMVDQTYQANAWRWAEAWERAYHLEHR